MKMTISTSVRMVGLLWCLATAPVFLLRCCPYAYNFPAYPKITHTKSGAEGDPLNLVFVGSKDQITHSFQQAGWLIPDPLPSKPLRKLPLIVSLKKVTPLRRSVISPPLGNPITLSL